MNKELLTLQDLRDRYIRELGNTKHSTSRARELADDLFSLDLTVYSSTFSFQSLVYNAFALSFIDDRISLHPEQLKIITHIIDNDASIISAPTSFGKTFCIFEYIIRTFPRNVVLVVPTLALMSEYLSKIIRNYRDHFHIYKVHTGIDETASYDFDAFNIFVLTHDRVVNETAFNKLDRIDFLVIDEVYKLEKDVSDDRVLVLNMAYYYLAKRASKYVLLAPFISEVKDTDILDKKPVTYVTDYSPVVNQVFERPILNDNDRFRECRVILNKLDPSEKTMVYFPTVTLMYKYINNVIVHEPPYETSNADMLSFIEWARQEIHEDWCLVTALERGYLIHNGQIPSGPRMFAINNFEDDKYRFIMLCTATLLEGVNTTAKNIIITKPSRRSNSVGDSFTAFDFYNLVGRTGRLNRHFIGNAYYIKSPDDPQFNKADAIRTIRFEVTDDSVDIDIQTGKASKHDDVVHFLNMLGMNEEEYMALIGAKVRFSTVVELYGRYIKYKWDLIDALKILRDNARFGRYSLVKELDKICEASPNKLRVNLITGLLNRNRPRLRTVINDTARHHNKVSINYIISEAIRLKSGYIENAFYNRVSVIRIFLIKDGTNGDLIEVLDGKIVNTIEYLYFAGQKYKKTLLDLGIYERDINNIIKVIGEDIADIHDLKRRLNDYYSKLAGISFISRYVIRNII